MRIKLSTASDFKLKGLMQLREFVDDARLPIASSFSLKSLKTF
nr:hypothetical protein [uncultured Rhodoferax sp.]